MDYKELLKKYMAHVGDCEGVNCLDQTPASGLFSQEEWDELQKLEGEPYDEN